MIRVSRKRRTLRRLVLALSASLFGGCSCVDLGGGDSGCDLDFSSNVSGQVFVHNASEIQATVTISRVPWMSCREAARVDDGFLRAADFSASTTLLMEPDELRAVDAPCECPHVRVEALGASRAVRWSRDLPVLDLGKHPDVETLPELAPQLITLDRSADGATLALGESLEAFAISGDDGPLPRHDCEEAGLESMRFSTARRSNGVPPIFDVPHPDLVVITLSERDDACFDVELEGPVVSNVPRFDGGVLGGEAGAAGAPGGAGAAGAPDEGDDESVIDVYELSICAPRFLFPFELGESLELVVSHFWMDLQGAEGRKRFRILGGPLDLPAWSRYSVRDRVPACGPVRESDGAVWEPVELLADDQLLVAGAIQRVRSTIGVEAYPGRSTKNWRGTCDLEPPMRIEIVERTLR